MKTKVLGIGEYSASKEPCELVCHGLGSCLGLFLFDRTHKIGGGAHIQLPENTDHRQPTDGRFAEFALYKLMEQMFCLGSAPGYMVAKLAGGASVSSSNAFNVGEKNLKKVRDLLLFHQIYLSKSDIGGTSFRKVRFSTQDGKLAITKINVEIIL